MSSTDQEGPDSSQKRSGRRRSNSISMCPMPGIPEYPGFQDLKVSLAVITNLQAIGAVPGTKGCLLKLGTRSLPPKLHSSPALSIPGSKGNSASQKSDSTVAIHTLAQWSLQFQSIAGLSGDFMLPNTSGQFHDKSLEDYFHERLMELKHRPIQAARPSC